MAIKLPRKLDPKNSQGMGFQLIPDGKYIAAYLKGEMKKTKDFKTTKNQYLELDGKILAGPQKGKTFKRRLNIVNKSKAAEDIAYAELETIGKAVGIEAEIDDAALLLKKPFWIDIFVKRATEAQKKKGGMDGNEVRGYDPIEGDPKSAIKKEDSRKLEPDEVDDDAIEGLDDDEDDETAAEVDDGELDDDDGEPDDDGDESGEPDSESEEKMPWEE